MKDGWSERLREVITADGRTYRALSLDAGLGPNYLEQTFKRGSSPGQDKLAAILDQLGQPAALYVYTGLRLSPEAVQALSGMSALSEGQRKAVLDLLAGLLREQSSQSL